MRVLLSVVLVVSCCVLSQNASPALAYQISINTLFNEKPIGDVKVFLWETNSHLNSNKPHISNKTNDKGKLTINLGESSYYITAEKRQNDKRLFGFYGLNPLSVNKNVTINITMVKYPEEYIKKTGIPGIAGTIYNGGQPISDVGVYLYLDLNAELKGPPYMVVFSGKDGQFFADPGAGSYYIFFRKKTGSDYGPPEPGDFVGFFPVFPVSLDKGGVILKAELLRIPEKMKSNFIEKNILLSGKVLKGDGKPLIGAYVVSYNREDVLGKPDSVSSPTDESGGFNLFLKNTDKVIIAVRNTLGETPATSDLFYVFGDVFFSAGEQKKIIEIRVNE